jgi:uncharacterized protein YukE
MADLHGISEDVRFDWAAAQRLSAELRAAATACDGQIPRRTGFAREAQQEWRGVFAQQFTGRMQVCAADARRLAEAMRTAATRVDELARLAREEQNRREQARAWQQQHDHRSTLQKVEDFFTGDDDLPPVPDPVQPPSWVVSAPVTSTRG